MTLPTFLVIGAMKAGTTSLHAYLARHPEITMSDPKELDFFVAEKNWGRGIDWYARHFAGADPGQPRGESSPNYAKAPMFAGVPERTAQVLPGVQLVYMVRDPVERMRSHYEHAVRHGTSARPIEVELLDNDHLVACSSYARQLDEWRTHVPLERILVVPSEELRDDRIATVRRIVTFLGADPDGVADDLDEELHRSRDGGATGGLRAWRDARRHRRDRELLDTVRNQLRERFVADVARLHRLTGVTIPGWEDVV